MSSADSVNSSAPGRRRVLLVEDNDAASKGLAKILVTLGFDVTVVTDGTSAIDVLQRTAPPDFLLTDLRLPDLDGREVALFASRLVPKPRVALITGWDLEAEHEESASWGVDWIFAKPLNVYELISKLRESPRADGAPAPPHRESRDDDTRTP